ncbi:hypothetical protein DPMN_144452 [Dreissena polymorpha]|uniref:EB domain-containing protein n=1 Tax=Dreissena polymorpha TaxID=45954 RepID=A0A9D4JKZ2_DREPO|nr:hypothetical protein DPMN_144452 [Dreissena polymorpha]
MTTMIAASDVAFLNFLACFSDSDCLTSNSDCRNGLVCECVAGYSYHETTGACVTSKWAAIASRSDMININPFMPSV